MTQYTDPKTGIVVTSNGSDVAEAFLVTFMKISQDFEEHENAWIARLRKEGVKAAHPDDGWVDRKINTIWFSYPQFDDNCQVGDLVALGHHDHYRIVELLSEVPSLIWLGDKKPKRFHFKEIDV